MPVTITIVNPGSHGQFFRANGKKRPDSWLFNRDKKQTGSYTYIFPSIADFNKESEDLLGAQGNPPMRITIDPDPGEASAALQQVHDTDVSNLQQEIKEREDRIAALSGEVSELQGKIVILSEGGNKLTDNQIAQLRAYDDMLELLVSRVESEDETPIDVLRRIMSQPATDNQSESPGSEPNPTPPVPPDMEASPKEPPKSLGKSKSGQKKGKNASQTQTPPNPVD